jgi:hypothetical protein
MKQHFCSAENSLIQYEKECNWCGEKEWVGLTYEEESELIRLAHNHAGIRFYIQAAEAKLKEKNL